jgi:hypothetical protein
MPSKLAFAFAKEEGFGIPGAIPTVRNNPGDLRHSPHSTHPPGDPNGIGWIDTIEHGWEDLDRQLSLYAERGMTIEKAVYVFAPPTENRSAAYLAGACKTAGCSPGDLVSEVLAAEAQAGPVT